MSTVLSLSNTTQTCLQDFLLLIKAPQQRCDNMIYILPAVELLVGRRWWRRAESLPGKKSILGSLNWACEWTKNECHFPKPYSNCNESMCFNGGYAWISTERRRGSWNRQKNVQIFCPRTTYNLYPTVLLLRNTHINPLISAPRKICPSCLVFC